MPWRRWAPPPAALLFVAACVSPPAPPRADGARFVVGEPYQMGGVWSYPREDHGLAESGLAVVIADPPRGQRRRTANGEVYDAAALVAAHRTLQLPAVVSVWSLDTGRELRVRVNDRGPAEPGRVVGLSRRAAELLGVDPARPARVRIAIDPAASRAAAEGLPGAEGPRLAVAAAPVAAVEQEQLAPPPGARAASVSTRGEAVRSPAVPAVAAVHRPPGRAPERLPEQVAERGVAPSRLVVDAGTFFRRDLAERRAAALGGRVEALATGRQPEYRVRVGPFASVLDADRALAGVLARGVPDAKIVLE